MSALAIGMNAAVMHWHDAIVNIVSDAVLALTAQHLFVVRAALMLRV
jgi:hypothetical protein